MKILIDQLSKNDIDEFTYFLVYQSVRSTVTLINQNNFEMQNNALEYLEWLLRNTQRFLKLNINQVQPLVTTTLRILVKNQPSYNEKVLNLLNVLKTLNDQNNDHQTNYGNVNTLYGDINSFLTEQKENTDIIQSLQNIKLKVCS